MFGSRWVQRVVYYGEVTTISSGRRLQTLGDCNLRQIEDDEGKLFINVDLNIRSLGIRVRCHPSSDPVWSTTGPPHTVVVASLFSFLYWTTQSGIFSYTCHHYAIKKGLTLSHSLKYNVTAVRSESSFNYRGVL